jgi:hypothetical protein
MLVHSLTHWADKGDARRIRAAVHHNNGRLRAVGTRLGVVGVSIGTSMCVGTMRMVIGGGLKAYTENEQGSNQ